VHPPDQITLRPWVEESYAAPRTKYLKAVVGQPQLILTMQQRLNYVQALALAGVPDELVIVAALMMDAIGTGQLLGMKIGVIQSLCSSWEMCRCVDPSRTQTHSLLTVALGRAQASLQSDRHSMID
jgi:hypothetical protein